MSKYKLFHFFTFTLFYLAVFVVKLLGMWTKIYLIALAVFIIPMGFFTVWSWNWLQSIGDPKVTVEKFELWSGYYWTTLFISSVVLLILANIALWKTRKSWMVWTTGAYFVVFIIIKYFWLDQSFFQFKKLQNMTEGSFSVAPVFGAILCLLAIAIVFFNQFIVLRMNEKMHPTAPLPQPSIDEISGDVIDESEKIN